MVNKRLL